MDNAALVIVSHFYSGTSHSEIDVHTTLPAKKARVDPFADLRDGSNSTTNQDAINEFSGREELSRYKALRVPANYGTPLMFWNANSKEFPLMSQVARRVLCISASSAQSERDFSSVGRTLTDARTRLSPGKVEAIEIIRWGCRASIINFKK